MLKRIGILALLCMLADMQLVTAFVAPGPLQLQHRGFASRMNPSKAARRRMHCDMTLSSNVHTLVAALEEADAGRIAPVAKVEPSLLMQIVGGDSLLLTGIATITLLLGVVVTVGVVYLTFKNWQDDQYKKKLQDPSSAEYRDLMNEMQMLEAGLSGNKGKKGKSKAMQEAMSMETSKSGKPPPNLNPMLAEPGNRDQRREKAKRKRAEEKQEMAAQKKVAARGKKMQDDSLSSLSDNKNKGFFNGLMDNFT